MLVLSRRKDQRIQIGPDITITVVRIGEENVRIGVEAPEHVKVLREELLEKGRPLQADCGQRKITPEKGGTPTAGASAVGGGG